MIEKTILDYLNSALDAPVSMEYPEDQSGDFVVLEKTGSGRVNHVNNAMFAIQSISDSLLGAATLNEAVKLAMDSAASLAEVCSANLNSDYNFTDTSTKQYRYQAIYDITHY